MGNQENQRGCDLDPRVLKNIQEVKLRETSPKWEDDYCKDRNVCGYYDRLGGLSATLKYIRDDVKDSNVVVDVGTGYGLTWACIEYEQGEGLEFWATGLIEYTSCREMFDNKFRCTPAEIMEGFESNSVGGIVAVCSITYGSPKPCIDRLNEILVSGGVIKACFEDPEFKISGDLFKTHYLFTARLLELGYDVVVKNGTIVVAVKPGGLVRASDLLENDFKMYCSNGY